MKITRPPIVDDLRELQGLANRTALGSYPKLMQSYVAIKDQYAAYSQHNGDPWKLNPTNLDTELSRRIKGHYDKPPKDCLTFIPETRYEMPTLICLMCGGFGMGTLDHYLPKDIYPEFALFSENLVPACNCNSLRGTAHKGTATPQRVIHPYFDQFIGDQLYQAKFDGDFESPRISIEVIDENHPNFQTIQFHLETVILNDSTQGWFEKYWGQLLVRPERILKLVLPNNQLTEVTLSSSLQDYKEAKDDEYDTPNNWFSMLYSGLIADVPRVKELANIINRRRT
ncbi:hypothetical protein [Alteromonas stellipolaris]|uniref:hypothetical protein n=1 Tax=Alteromonas stellipolaris TaxID=233316 RepID=UPI0024955B7F|nr:hypothetical protein [Alteromonas stellipolaris]